MNPIKSLEIEIPPIHDVKRSRFRDDLVQDIHIVHFASADADFRRDGTSQIQEGMQLDGPLRRSKPGPGKHRKTEIDCRGVEGVDGVVEFHSKVVSGVELPRRVNQSLGKIGVNLPIPPFVGIGQRAARDQTSYPHVIQFCLLSPKTSLDIPATFPLRQLGKRQAKILIETGKTLDLVVPPIPIHTPTEGVHRKRVHHLRENNLSCVHEPLLLRRNDPKSFDRRSNR